MGKTPGNGSERVEGCIQRLVFGGVFLSVFSFLAPNMIPPMQATMSGYIKDEF